MISALAQGSNLTQAAERAGCSPRTVARRLQREDFRQLVSVERRNYFDRASGLLAGAFMSAAATLVDLSRRSTNDSVRLGAARAVLEWGERLRDNLDLEERVAALEAERPNLRSVT